MNVRTLDIRPPVLRETTGERIRRLRLESGRSIVQLAHEAGISRKAVANAESDGDVYLYTFARIAEALGVEIGHLWDGRTE